MSTRSHTHAGSKRPPDPPPSPAELARLIQEAIAEGRHSPISKWRTLCDGCRQWVCAIYYTTVDKRRLCGECAAKIGQGPTLEEPRVQQAQVMP